MRINTFEVRSEEEYVGNILLLVGSHSFLSDAEAIQNLWIEAQDYIEEVAVSSALTDFRSAEQNFDLRSIRYGEFMAKAGSIFQKLSSYPEGVEEIPIGSFSQIKSGLNGSIYSDETKTIVLVENYSTYVVYLRQNSTRAFFSWCDVV